VVLGQQLLRRARRQTCAVLDDGTAWCWGRNDNGELGNGSLDQTVLPVQVAGLVSVVEVAIGEAHACARTSDDALWCWGGNGVGQLGTGRTGQTARSTIPVRVASLGARVTGLAVGSGATCARGVDGSVWCWGARTLGMLGDGAVGFTPSPVAPAGCP
jgi:alpha-tubulin suppressor-like RCC1 family protein